MPHYRLATTPKAVGAAETDTEESVLDVGRPLDRHECGFSEIKLHIGVDLDPIPLADRDRFGANLYRTFITLADILADVRPPEPIIG